MTAVARKGDREVIHCSMPKRLGAFGTVIANGIRMSGVGHMNTPHLLPCPCPVCCCIHSFPLLSGSPNVFAEGIPIGRVGDPTCTAVAQGSPNVFANGGGPSSTSLTGLSTTSKALEGAKSGMKSLPPVGGTDHY